LDCKHNQLTRADIIGFSTRTVLECGGLKSVRSDTMLCDSECENAGA